MKFWYVARPIDHHNGDKFIHTIGETVEYLKELASEGGRGPGTNEHRAGGEGVVIYDPATAFQVAKPSGGWNLTGEGDQAAGLVSKVNAEALKNADLVIAFWSRNTPSYGVPNEIGIARALGKPVVLVTEGEQWTGFAPLGDEGVYIERVDAYRPDQAKAVMDKIWRGEIGNEAPDTWGSGRETTMVDGSINIYHAPEPLNFKYVDLQDGGDLPSRGHHDDAGLDLYVSETVTVEPGEFIDIATNIAIELPKGTWGYLTGRSSTLRKKSLLVNPGVIDAGYRGELYSGVWNLGNQPVTVFEGDRIAQLILLPNLNEGMLPTMVSEFTSETLRGEGGFGSTGT